MKTTSVDKAFREMIREEIQEQLEPLRQVVTRLQSSAAGLDRLHQLAAGLGPLTALLGGRGGTNAAGRRGASALPALRTGRRGRPATLNNRACAIIGCPRPARTKGYCAAHYQKLRSLTKTGRLPGEWRDFAPPSSVKDVVLPRGRAAAKLKAQAGKRRKS